jgi:hypothetical protein
MLSPIGIKNAESQLLNYPEEMCGLKILLNLSNYNYTPSLWDEVINLDNGYTFESRHDSLKNKLIFQYKRIKYYKVVFDLIRKNIDHYSNLSKLNFYYQNLEDPLSNRLYFHNWKHPFHAFIIEEGIANYYDYYATTEGRMLNLLKKKIFHKLFNFTYIIPESLTGIHYQRTIFQYVRMPELSNNPEKSRQLAFEQLHYIPITGRVLLIGQESSINLLGVEKYINCLTLLTKRITHYYPGALIYYKRHWNSNFDLSKSEYLFNFIFIDDRSSVESLLGVIQPEVIISFTSSALINIALSTTLLQKRNQISIYRSDLFSLNIQEIERIFNHLNINDLT